MACTMLLGATAIVTAAAAQAGDPGGRTWKIEPTRNAAGAEISTLSSVSCPSGRVCIAVGSSAATPASPTRSLAERWNGKHWRLQHIPTPRGTSDVLFGVSCPSARACVAVGDAFRRRDRPLVEVWNGSRWRVQHAPAGKAPSSLYAISCTSRRACTAVGHDFARRPHAIVRRWDGKTWRVQAVPRGPKGAGLLGVSCPRARACTAVGYRRDGRTGNARPLAESWRGGKWRVRSMPLPQGSSAGMLEAVSCTAPRRCTATGTDFDGPGPTLAERWNGRRWRVEPTPNPPNFRSSRGEVALDGVSCTSASACTASGDYSPGGAAAYFVESWDGTTWRLETTPRPVGFQHGALLGVSCASVRCTAVGAYTGPVRLQVTLAMGD